MQGRVVVTGGAGFIGSHLVDALVARGDDVHVVDDLSTGRRARVPDEATLHVVDVADDVALGRLVDSHGPFDCWYHFAAQADVRVSVEHPMTDARVNVLGTVAVLGAAQRDDAPVVFASTGGAIYGEAEPPTDEHAPERPESPYGAAKLAAEQYVNQDARLNGGRHVVLRFANVYGPRQDPHGEAGVVAIFGGCIIAGRAARVYGDGLQTRDYVFVGDVVESALAAADAAGAGTDAALRADGDVPTYNVGTGRETSVLELWSSMQRAAGVELGHELHPRRDGELQRSALDPSRMRDALGVRIDTDLLAGLAATIEWQRGQVPA